MKPARRITVPRFCLASVAAVAVLNGCTVGEDYVPPATTQAGPLDEWEARVDASVVRQPLDPEVLASWWTTLDDAKLTDLIGRATDANLDLRAASAQLRQARAERKIAAAEGAPQIGLSAGAQSSRQNRDTTSLYSAGLDASWELDLFGRIARGVEAAEAELQATEENRRDVLVSVLAEVAVNYAELRTLQQQRLVTQSNLELQQESLRIAEAQERLGEASPLDVDRARANVETTRAVLPTLEQQIEQVLNRLAVLVGENPGVLDTYLGEPEALPVPPVTVAVGVPAEVLRRRPDVRRAERQLAAQSARVGVALAELYPKFTLNGTIGLQAPSTSSLFDAANLVFSVGPRAQWTIYDGGRLRQQVEVQDALQEQALVEYERSILTALEDVENAVTAYVQEQIRYVSLQSAEASAARAADAARARYEAGETDFLAVLDAQRTLLDSQDALAQSEGLIVGNLIRLYKSLGGGWSPEPPEAPEPAETSADAA
ncbi:MAG: efflux transporter outer membrane subunit [Planctomycetota bacterium]